jgi:hypothetical protein
MLRFDKIKAKLFGFLEKVYHLSMAKRFPFAYLKAASPVVGTEGFFHAVRKYFYASVGNETQF